MPIKSGWEGDLPIYPVHISLFLVLRFRARLAKPIPPSASTGLFPSKLPGLLPVSFVFFPGKSSRGSSGPFFTFGLDQGM